MASVDRQALLAQLEAPLGLTFPDRSPEESLAVLLEEAGMDDKAAFTPDDLGHLGELLNEWGDRELRRALGLFEATADAEST
jgi:hypothetical protein